METTSITVISLNKFYLQHMLVHGQSGVGDDYPTQELDMETTSITTTSTELPTLDNSESPYTSLNVSWKK